MKKIFSVVLLLCVVLVGFQILQRIDWFLVSVDREVRLDLYVTFYDSATLETYIGDLKISQNCDTGNWYLADTSGANSDMIYVGQEIVQVMNSGLDWASAFSEYEPESLYNTDYYFVFDNRAYIEALTLLDECSTSTTLFLPVVLTQNP